MSSISLPPYDSHLGICHLNIQSIVPKLDILQYEMQMFDIFIFTETWINSTIKSSDLKIANFKEPFRCDRESRSGGVAIYVKDSIECIRRCDLEVKDLESVWVQINSHGRKILICGMYRPPNSHLSYWNLVSESIDRAKSTNIQDILILGDFNNDFLFSHKSKHLRDVMMNFNLSQMIAEPTHFTESSSSLIDVILVSNSNNVLASEVCDPFIPNVTRYHCPIAVLLKFLKPKQKHFRRRIWKYDQGDYINYRQILSEVNWDDTLSGDVDGIAEKLTSTILTAASNSIPNKLVTIRPKDPPWMHNEIRKLIRQRKRLHRKAKRSNSTHLWSKFRKLRNKVVKEIKLAKSNYEKHVANILKNNTNNVKTWWKLSKQILNMDKSSETIPTLIYNNKEVDSDIDKAEVFNSFFISQSQLDDNRTILPEPKHPQHDLIDYFDITVQEVFDILKGLDISKASGPDLVNPRLLKEGAPHLSAPLSKFFNHLLSVGKFPQSWKEANVTPV
ncbi:MAG: endonuclease/exonuclease/phosphatase family protein, partial [Candidatus Thiodiazotropha sp.]